MDEPRHKKVRVAELTHDQVKAWEHALEVQQPVAWEGGAWLVVGLSHEQMGQAMEPVFVLAAADPAG